VRVKALIKVGYACNEKCTFCHTADVRHLDDSVERVDWKIDRARLLGHSMIVLSGGEPTLRPELLHWARRVAGHGLDFGLVTNGLMLSYPHVTSELIEQHRLRYVYMSLHGGEAKVHRSVVRADTFERALAAIELLHGRVPDLTINCVVTNANLNHLRGVVDRLIGYPELGIKFSMTQPKGAANRVFDIIVPRVEECAAKILDAIEYGLERRGSAPGPRFAHDGVPLCLLPGLERHYDDLKTHGFATMIEADEDDFVPVDEVAKVQTEKCAPCSLRGACPGLYGGYYEAYGDDVLVARVGEPRSNSFTFVPTRDITRSPGAPCPIRSDGVSPYDRGRTLFLRLKGRMRLFRAETRDFSDAELFTTKEELGQVYLDVSTKLAPDDFAKDLRKLVRAKECNACPEEPRCTGAWEPVPDDVFSRDDRRVRELIAGLTGRVLDLGCGDGPYLDSLAARVREGAIDYVGVDPDAERLAVLASRYAFALGGADAASSRACFVVARGEELTEELGLFDHILVLRSYNHLTSPEQALDRAIALLKPGGSLVVVDNVAFGLVRQARHAARAELAPENRFEHYRNDGAQEAAQRLVGRGLSLVERCDVGPTTSNQWMLRYERALRI
jgi:MoaA/NifB/PqqE/SkfB family radical SAM enzyme/SAM-dependent methyltransferase